MLAFIIGFALGGFILTIAMCCLALGALPDTSYTDHIHKPKPPDPLHRSGRSVWFE